jgi:hypothetical protein
MNSFYRRNNMPNDTKRTVNVDNAILTFLLEESKRVKEELEGLEGIKTIKLGEALALRDQISKIELELNGIDKNIDVLKINKGSLTARAEEMKKMLKI